MNAWNWTAIDPVTLAERRDLNRDDVCFYYMTRDGRGYNASPENNLINDFKKDPDRFRDRPDVLAYKRAAMDRCTDFVADFFLSRSTIFSDQKVLLVPMPTSIPRGDCGRDDRLDILCSDVSERVPFVEHRPLIDVTQRLLPAHAGGPRSREELRRYFTWSGELDFDSDIIVLFDDVLTTGSHYAICRDGVRKRYGSGRQVIGLFLALHTWPS